MKDNDSKLPYIHCLKDLQWNNLFVKPGLTMCTKHSRVKETSFEANQSEVSWTCLQNEWFFIIVDVEKTRI